ncbi:MAG: DUF4432 family protein [bacterium]
MFNNSDRNFGCRYMEVSLGGNRLLIIENEKLRLSILPDQGCDIVEFLHKESDISFLWRTLKGLNSLDKRHKHYSDFFYQAYHGGWFEAFPNVGLSCNHNGLNFEPYDEVKYLPWDYEVQKDTPGELRIKFTVQTLKTPFILEKTLVVESGSYSVMIEESIVNMGREPLGYQWGHHPLLGEPFLSGDCVIDFPGGNINTYFEFDEARVKQGEKGEWPIMQGKNGKVDLHQFPAKNSGINEFYWISELKGNWVAVRNQSLDLGFGLSWDPDMFNNCLFWYNANGDKGYPHYGNAYIFCIMPSTSDTHTIEEEVKKGTINIINPGESARTWITATIFKSNKEVNNISRKGEVS